MDKPCVLLQLLTPSVDKIEHDHMYVQQTLVSETSTDLSTPPTTISPTAEELEVMCQETRKAFNVSSAERKNIEMRTRGSSTHLSGLSSVQGEYQDRNVEKLCYKRRRHQL